MKFDVILYVSISFNVIFIILAVRIFYSDRKLWSELVEHDEKIDSLLQDMHVPKDTMDMVNS